MLNTIKRVYQGRAGLSVGEKKHTSASSVKDHAVSAGAPTSKKPVSKKAVPQKAVSKQSRANKVRTASLSESAENTAIQKTALGHRIEERWKRTCIVIEEWCARVDIAPDLANDIGSRTWLRGFATLIALIGAAIAFLPRYSAFEAATAMPLDIREQEEIHSHAIAPLGLGADSGRQMGATPLVRRLANVPDRPEVKLVATLGQGDSFTRMLERTGLGPSDADEVTRLVSEVMPISEISSGTQFDITLGKRTAADSARRLESVNFRAKFELDVAIQRRGQSLALVRYPIRVDETPLRIRGTVGSSLYRSARNAGAPVSAIQAYLRAVDKYASIDRALGAKDQFDLIVSYKRSAKGDRVVGDLLYAGIERQDRSGLQLVRWGKDGEMYAASSIEQSRSVPIGQPVAGHMTSKYGARRHPILGYVRMHAGVDYGARHGSPIYAVADGQVVFSGRNGGHGNYVRLRHGGGIDTGYSHMSRIAVRGGMHVRAGQVIGYVGSTGLSTGPHLHFEAYRGGRTINPVGVAVIARPQLDERERVAFKARLNGLLQIKPGAALGSIAEPEIELNGAAREIDKLADVELKKPLKDRYEMALLIR